MTQASLTNDEIGQTICAARLEGFGGRCYAAAVVLNAEVFAGKGTLVGAFNRAFQESGGHYFGHVAVLFHGVYWDADGRPKPWDEIESWGMLDAQDSEYKTLAEETGFTWDEAVAGEIIRIEDAARLHRAFDSAHSRRDVNSMRKKFAGLTRKEPVAGAEPPAPGRRPR